MLKANVNLSHFYFLIIIYNLEANCFSFKGDFDPFAVKNPNPFFDPIKRACLNCFVKQIKKIGLFTAIDRNYLNIKK